MSTARPQSNTEASAAEKSSENVRAVDRALEILLAFSAQDHEMTAGDLLRRVDLSRPTLYRLLKTLEHKGFVSVSGDPQRFSLGPSVAQLAHVWTSTLDITTAAQPMLRSLWSDTGETVALMLHQGNVRVCAAEMPSSQPLSFKRGVGHSVHVAIGASGRAILAFADDADTYIKEVIAGDRQVAYELKLGKVREQGYAVSKDELIQGAVAVAVPFFTANSKVMGSLAVFGPSVRVGAPQIARFVVLLKAQSLKLSKALGTNR